MELCETHKTDHLFLLVGNNPLPNLVVGSLLLKSEGFLHLIHTDNTFQYANNIKILISQRLNFPISHIKLISLHLATDQAAIFQDLQTYFNSEPSLKTGSIGLNYTGGMKPMSVHIFEFLKEYSIKGHGDFIHSYLDPIHYALRFNHGISHTISYDEFQVDLKDLLELHTKLVSSSKKGALFPSYCQWIAHFASDPGKMKKLRSWCDKCVRTINEKELDSVLSTLSYNGTFLHSNFPDLESLFTEMEFRINSLEDKPNDDKDEGENQKKENTDFIAQVGLALLDTNEIPEDEVHHWQSKSIAGSIIKFLDGGWLENYVLHCLSKISNECHIHEFQKSMYIKSADLKSTITGFEFDVAAMQGYRLYAISCSTSMKRSLVKGKLMEAFTRAKQMGGDESRVGLVSGYLQPNNLLEEINESWMASRDKIRIFGPQDLDELPEKFKEWFSL